MLSEPVFLEKGLRHLRRVDKRFSYLVREHGRPTYKRSRNAFQSLSRSIVYQQLNGNAAGTIFGRFRALFPGGAFPAPEAVLDVSTQTLRSVGLSRAKAEYVQELARHFASGAVQTRKFSRQTDEEISAALTAVKGVGQWTVDMYLMFGLNRADVLPLGDYAVRKAMRHFFAVRGKVKDQRLRELAEPWRPFRSLACWYMWRISDSM